MSDIQNVSVEIALPGGLVERAVNEARRWFPRAIREVRNPEILVLGMPDEFLRDEKIREKFISLVGNTPGLADLLVEAFRAQGIDPGQPLAIDLTLRRDDRAQLAPADPLGNAIRIRDALAA